MLSYIDWIREHDWHLPVATSWTQTFSLEKESTIGISQLPRREPKLSPENNISYVAQNMCIQLEFVMK